MRIWKNKYGWVKKSDLLTVEHKRNPELLDNQALSTNLEVNLALIKKLMANPQDLSIREFTIAFSENRAAIILVEGLAQQESINEQVLKPLMLGMQLEMPLSSHELFDRVKKHNITNIVVEEHHTLEEVINDIISGDTVLLLDGVEHALMISSKGWKDRSVSEPITETIVRGPRDGFTETLRTNTSLIRRRIKSPDLRLEGIKVGTQTKTDIVIVYLEGIAKKGVVDEVKNRIGRIEIDGILESGYLEEFIEDSPYSPFPQIEHTERPDKVAAAILEGRVAILVDTTPFALIVPTVFLQFIQSAEDYYERFYLGSLIRVIRLIALFVSVTLPAIFIALTSFHQELIPTPLALSIAASREGVPFPTTIEALLMGLFFEILREAGLRLPRPSGQAVSIVGGLVIGQAAVQAGIFSQAMVIVVALTGISSFAIPAYNAALSGQLLRVPLVILAGTFGLPGIIAGLSIILIHMCSLRVFGINYLTPVTYSLTSNYKDVLIRVPWWAMLKRPRRIAGQDQKRERTGMRPGPKYGP